VSTKSETSTSLPAESSLAAEASAGLSSEASGRVSAETSASLSSEASGMVYIEASVSLLSWEHSNSLVSTSSPAKGLSAEARARLPMEACVETGTSIKARLARMETSRLARMEASLVHTLAAVSLEPVAKSGIVEGGLGSPGCHANQAQEDRYLSVPKSHC